MNSPLFYRTLSAAPATPPGLMLFRVDLTTCVPDDDGKTRYSVWLFASDGLRAYVKARVINALAGEGGEVVDVEREEEMPELTAAQERALNRLPKTWRHPSWVPDEDHELVDLGLAIEISSEDGPHRIDLTPAGRAVRDALEKSK